jgi:hypothetical protein
MNIRNNMHNEVEIITQKEAKKLFKKKKKILIRITKNPNIFSKKSKQLFLQTCGIPEISQTFYPFYKKCKI